MARSTHNRLRFLLVGADPGWQLLVGRVASRLDAGLDIVDDIDAALAWMLQPGRVYDQVLAATPIDSRAVDSLAGMLDEVTLKPTRLLLLGSLAYGGANAVRCLPGRDEAALTTLLSRNQPDASVALPALTSGEIAAALHGGGLRMRFQPILRAADLRPIGLEALARVHTRSRGILHPKDFIPPTQACGREPVLAGIAAARTFLDIGKQLAQGDLFVSINLPLSTVQHEGSLSRGLELCAVSGIDPARVLLEVLESRSAPDLGRLRAALDRWREAGFRTAIDDAGPALPHWRDLIDLPFDAVKLDGALAADAGYAGLLHDIVAQAKERGRFIVAEGIEDEACLDRIRPLQVDALQGFLFSRPLPAMAVPVWERSWMLRGQPSREVLAA